MVPSLHRPQDRTSVLKEEIEVEKSKIPEDWESEAADFLIKILVKNPALRLGRYGAFEGTASPTQLKLTLGSGILTPKIGPGE